MKEYFTYKGFDAPNQLDERQLPSYHNFYSKLKNSKPLDKEFWSFQKLLITGLSEEQVIKKFGLKAEPLA